MKNIVIGAVRESYLIEQGGNRAGNFFTLLLRSEPDIVGNRPREEKSGLRNHAHPPSQFTRWDLSVVHSFQVHPSAGGFVQAVQQTEKGSLTGATWPSDRQYFGL